MQNLIDLFLLETHTKNNDEGPFVSGLHSGNLGDIIYSLPTVYQLNINHYILNILEDPWFRGRELREGAAKALVPLLLAQESIKKITIIRSNVAWEFANLKKFGIDYNLDSCRTNWDQDNLHLIHRHALPYNLSVDGSRRWLTIPNNYHPAYLPQQKYIAVSLTPRYRRFDQRYYEALLKYIPPEHIYFIGTEKDQVERSNLHGNIYKAKDFLELASFINNASLFIGCPSFPNALAEGLKKKRLVEVPEKGNAYPLDDTGTMMHLCDMNYLREIIKDSLHLKDHQSIVYSELVQKIKSLETELSVLQKPFVRAGYKIDSHLKKWPFLYKPLSFLLVKVWSLIKSMKYSNQSAV